MAYVGYVEDGPTPIRIVGTRERVEACAMVRFLGIKQKSWKHTGETKVFWDTCETQRDEKREVLFLGEDGLEYTLDQITIRRELDERDRQIVALARKRFHQEGELEIDDEPEVSELPDSEENGAYVRAWVWVNFSGTPLDKEKEE